MNKNIIKSFVYFVAIFLLVSCVKMKEAGKDVGHTTKEVTTEIGHTTKKVTKKIGHTTKKVTKKIGHATRDTVNPKNVSYKGG
jgi:hypothetical protein